jgi:hypothetical protein
MLFILIPIHTKGFLDFEPLCARFLASRFANCYLMTLKIISHKFNMDIKKTEFDAGFEFIEKLQKI